MSPSSKDPMLRGRRCALCVGIGTYTNLINRDLRYAVADATTIAERLADPLRGNFAVTLLTEPAQTSKAALEEALDELLNTPDRQAEDVVVIYFACHGAVYTPDNTFCLQPSNTVQQADGTFKRTTLISIYDLAKLLSGAKAQNIVVLLDVCHSGGAGVALQHLKLDLSAGPNLFIIGAARQDQVTRQSSQLQHGLFTHCLLRAFEQPPLKDGWLTVSQIHSFVSDEIGWFAKDQAIQIQGWSISVNPNLPLLRNPGYPELCPLPPIWNVPLQRNRFFTGQEDLLVQLATMFQSNQKTALTQPLAITGLGGIGKTQLAVEYAYRHRQNYHAILWARADSRKELSSSFLVIASLLDVPQKDEKDKPKPVEAIIEEVKAWLVRRSGWLLIVDNADDLTVVKAFLPPAFQGHLLLTTRFQVMGGLARKLEVEVMRPEIGALLLLRRVELLAPVAPLEGATAVEVTEAKELAEELGGLPLALDQAGAYIEEVACSLQEYRRLYQLQRTELLKTRGGIVLDHPQPVATTWKLAFERVEQANPAAADLLRLCAFLHSEAIPEELISRGTAVLDPPLKKLSADPLAFNAALRELRTYSLVYRDASNQTLSLHQLVQEVLKDNLDEPTTKHWAERTVQAVNAAFPHAKEMREENGYIRCKRLLLHALTCVRLIEKYQWLHLEAARLLHDTAYFIYYLYNPGTDDYQQAEPLYQQALAIYEQQLGYKHPDTLRSLEDLALFYKYQKKYEQAESLYQRILTIREQLAAKSRMDLEEIMARQWKTINRQADDITESPQSFNMDDPHERAMSAIWSQMRRESALVRKIYLVLPPRRPFPPWFY